MVALPKIERPPVRRARSTGEKFDAQAALEQAKSIYPKVMARLAE
ncbi:hypothetical protein [uncultured Sphingomonas sp.]